MVPLAKATTKVGKILASIDYIRDEPPSILPAPSKAGAGNEIAVRVQAESLITCCKVFQSYLVLDIQTWLRRWNIAPYHTTHRLHST